jgi:hypothetical protein
VSFGRQQFEGDSILAGLQRCWNKAANTHLLLKFVFGLAGPSDSSMALNISRSDLTPQTGFGIAVTHNNTLILSIRMLHQKGDAIAWLKAVVGMDARAQASYRNDKLSETMRSKLVCRTNANGRK